MGIWFWRERLFVSLLFYPWGNHIARFHSAEFPCLVAPFSAPPSSLPDYKLTHWSFHCSPVFYCNSDPGWMQPSQQQGASCPPARGHQASVPTAPPGSHHRQRRRKVTARAQSTFRRTPNTGQATEAWLSSCLRVNGSLRSRYFKLGELNPPPPSPSCSSEAGGYITLSQICWWNKKLKRCLVKCLPLL